MSAPYSTLTRTGNSYTYVPHLQSVCIVLRAWDEAADLHLGDEEHSGRALASDQSRSPRPAQNVSAAAAILGLQDAMVARAAVLRYLCELPQDNSRSAAAMFPLYRYR